MNENKASLEEMNTDKPRMLETVIGRNNAIADIQSRVSCFNDCNGENRMTIEANGLEAYDNEGSGEYYKAVCLNLNGAENCDNEIYEIQTLW